MEISAQGGGVCEHAGQEMSCTACDSQIIPHGYMCVYNDQSKSILHNNNLDHRTMKPNPDLHHQMRHFHLICMC